MKPAYPAVNVYPTKQQLAVIEQHPFTYDLHNAEFRAYWTSRTGYTWRGNRQAASKESADIVDILIARNDAALAVGGNYQCQWYQHVWNIWQTQLDAIKAQPYSYGLTDAAFREFLTLRTGETFLGRDPTGHPGIVDISSRFVSHSNYFISKGGNRLCDQYQELWDIWINDGEAAAA